jgi:hypothetical protein
MTTDNRWIARNFGRLMDDHGGRCVAVVGGRVVAVGDKLEQVEQAARRATGARAPALVRVPSKGQLGRSPFRLFGLS